jgi:hypothetical protein
VRSEQRQAQLMAEASAPAPHDGTLAPSRRRHYDRQATVEKIAANAGANSRRVVPLRVELATVRQNNVCLGCPCLTSAQVFGLAPALAHITNSTNSRVLIRPAVLEQQTWLANFAENVVQRCERMHGFVHIAAYALLSPVIR